MSIRRLDSASASLAYTPGVRQYLVLKEARRTNSMSTDGPIIAQCCAPGTLTPSGMEPSVWVFSSSTLILHTLVVFVLRQRDEAVVSVFKIASWQSYTGSCDTINLRDFWRSKVIAYRSVRTAAAKYERFQNKA